MSCLTWQNNCYPFFFISSILVMSCWVWTRKWPLIVIVYWVKLSFTSIGVEDTCLLTLYSLVYLSCTWILLLFHFSQFQRNPRSLYWKWNQSLSWSLHLRKSSSYLRFSWRYISCSVYRSYESMCHYQWRIRGRYAWQTIERHQHSQTLRTHTSVWISTAYNLASTHLDWLQFVDSVISPLCLMLSGELQ